MNNKPTRTKSRTFQLQIVSQQISKPPHLKYAQTVFFLRFVLASYVEKLHTPHHLYFCNCIGYDVSTRPFENAPGAKRRRELKGLATELFASTNMVHEHYIIARPGALLQTSTNIFAWRPLQHYPKLLLFSSCFPSSSPPKLPMIVSNLPFKRCTSLSRMSSFT